jgi:hypothetical protein
MKEEEKRLSELGKPQKLIEVDHTVTHDDIVDGVDEPT